MPKHAVDPKQSIPRIKKKPAPEVYRSQGAVQRIHFKSTKPQGLLEIKITDPKEMFTPTETVTPSVPDLLWL